MFKEKIKRICDYMTKYRNWILPLVIIIAVAITVFVALKANNDKNQEATYASIESDTISEAEPEEEKFKVPENVPLEEITSGDIYTLICLYYNAYASGDVEGIKALSNYMVDTDEIAIPKMSEYVESYSDVVVYSKPGPLENSYLAYVYYKMKIKGFEDLISGMETFYVCTDENGALYLNEGDVSEEELEYIKQISQQDDVVELTNRVNVECSETLANNASLSYYIQEFLSEVQKETGEELAAAISGEDVTGSGEPSETAAPDSSAGNDNQPVATSEPVTTGEPVYAKATTTVNVRSSDSTQADKVDKVTSGTQVEVLEQRVNGWSKIKVNGKEGFIKSEYLQMLSVVSSDDVVGTVTAKENVNVRSAASTSSDRLGILPGGTVVDLLANEGEWCKINYNGQVGYVKSEFVE